MKKKYTMEEFEKIYSEAVVKATESLLKEFKEASMGDELNPMAEFAFSMQNTLAFAELHKILFKEDK